MTPVYLPIELRELVENTAEHDGLSITAVVTRIVATSYGQSPPAYCQPRQQAAAQEELPLQEVPLKTAS